MIFHLMRLRRIESIIPIISVIYSSPSLTCLQSL